MDNKEYKFLNPSFCVDRKLYKYYSNVNYAIDSIKHKRIHLDSPEAFNDPFDCLYCVSSFSSNNYFGVTESIEKDIMNYIIGAARIKHPHYVEMITATNAYILIREIDYSKKPIRDILRDMYSAFGDVGFSFEEFCDVVDAGYEYTDGLSKLKVKVSCFSEVKDSVLMWSYYANSHKGVCLEYDLSKLDIDSELNDKIINNLAKVHYSPIRADSLFSFSNENNMLNFVVSKSNAWSHENEWRIICDTEEQYLPFDCVSGVYLGVNFDEKSKNYQKLLDAVKKYDDLSIKKSVLNSIDFNISFEEIYNSKLTHCLEKLGYKKGTTNYDLQKI